MSGASGKFPAAIHVGPEASRGGPLARVEDGDIIRLDAIEGRLELHVDEREFEGRKPVPFRPNTSSMGLGREMFGGFRSAVSNSEQGGSVFSMLGGV